MRLLITTPVAIVVDQADVISLRAEDESGGFGILPGHADFLTALTLSVVTWRSVERHQRFCAVRYGLLSVHQGKEVAIATREAVVGSDLQHLEQVVLAEFRRATEEERVARTESLKLQMRVIRQILQCLRPTPSTTLGEGA